MKSLLTVNYPGGGGLAGGTLNAMSRDQLSCHNCGELGLFDRECCKPKKQRADFNLKSAVRQAPSRAGYDQGANV
jgi:hypothetical protein